MTAQTAVETYVAAWNQPEDADRLSLLEQSFAADGTYMDPTAHVEGREALATHIGRFQAERPGGRFELPGSIQEHHGFVRFDWLLVQGDMRLTGMDFGEVDDEGRLTRIVGFFGGR